jgi:hypothetical protein
MITNKKLDRLQKLCDGATAGPWHTEDVGEPPKRRWVVDAQYRCVAGGTAGGIGPRAFDADFIAAARTALPELIAEVRRLQKRCEAAERDLELHGGCPSCAAQTGGGRVPCGFFALDTSVPRARCRNYSWRGPQPAKEDT